MAAQLRTPWVALYVETPHALRLSEAERDRIADALRLTERLGGEAVTIPGSELVRDIMDYAGTNNFSHVVIGKSQRSRLHELLFGSVTYEIVRCAGNVAVQVISGEERETVPAKTIATRKVSPGIELRPYLAVTGVVTVALGVGVLLTRFLDVQSIALVFLTGVLASAVGYGLWPAIFASLLSVLAFNFFFLSPIYTFTISDPENVVALFFFLVVALIASNLTASVRSQAVVARRRAKTTEDLYLFSRKLGGSASLDGLLWATASQVASMLRVRVVLFLPKTARSRFGRHGRPKTSRRKPISPPPNGPGKATSPQVEAQTRCRVRGVCSCRCAWAAVLSLSSVSTATRPGRS